MTSNRHHQIGLLLGAEEDWPRAFETVLGMVGPITVDGVTHTLGAERLTIEPFDLTDPVRTPLVIDRLAPAKAEDTALPDLNDMVSGEAPSFGTRTEGMRVVQVVTGSNAQGFGLKPGDVVRKINGRELPQGLDLEDFLGIYDAGEPMVFAVERDGRSVELRGNYTPTSLAKVAPIFSTTVPSGRVDLVREGNTIRATTRGVAAFTLLLSPDAIDFARPVTVIANGRQVFSGRVQKDLGTLLTWAARDNDRTMLYGAALPITLTR